MKKIKLYINGKTLDNVVIEQGFEIPFYNLETSSQEVPGRPGASFLRTSHKGDTISIPLIYKNHYAEKSSDEIRVEIEKWLGTDERKVQVEGHEWFWNGYINGRVTIPPNMREFFNFTIDVVLLDPYKYSLNTFSNKVIGDGVSIMNEGTAPTDFTLTATAMEDAKYFIIADEEGKHFLLGEDSEEVTVQNYSPSLLKNEFRDKIGFSRMSANESISDRYLGGITGAAFGQTVETWYLDLATVKQDNGWRGGALSYTFKRTAQNFKTTFKLNTHQRKMGSGKAAQFIYDNNGKLLFSIGYQNVHSTKDSGRLLFIAYNENGDEKLLWGPTLPTKLKRVPVLTIYFRLIRKGTTLEMSYWCYDDTSEEGRNPETLLQPVRSAKFNDAGKFYQRPVGNTRFGIFRGNGPHRYLSLLGVYMYELLDKPASAKDMLVNTGDIIRLSTKDKEVTINGVPVLTEKSFSSSFFELQPGLTNLLLSPVGIFDATVRWHDRYK